MWIFGLVLLAVAGGLFYGHRSKLKRLGQVVSTEVRTVAHLSEVASSMAEGFGAGSLRFPAAVEGKVRAAEPLVSELAERPAVYYSMSVHREYEEDRPRGGSREREDHGPRRASEQMAHNVRSIPFLVEDATGSIRVEPAGARFIAENALSRFEPTAGGEPRLRVGSFELAPRAAGGTRTLGYRFQEEVIPLDREVYILGEVSDPGGELRIGGPEGEGELLISTKSRAQLTKELGSGAKGLKIGSIVCGILGLLLVLFG